MITFTPEQEKRIWKAIDKCNAFNEHAFEVVNFWYDTSVNTEKSDLKIEWWCSVGSQRRLVIITDADYSLGTTMPVDADNA